MGYARDCKTRLRVFKKGSAFLDAKTFASVFSGFYIWGNTKNSTNFARM